MASAISFRDIFEAATSDESAAIIASDERLAFRGNEDTAESVTNCVSMITASSDAGVFDDDRDDVDEGRSCGLPTNWVTSRCRLIGSSPLIAIQSGVEG